jgi:acyl-CoA hydrolase
MTNAVTRPTGELSLRTVAMPADTNPAGDIIRTGRSSITLGVEAWVRRRGQSERTRVTAAEFVQVAVDDAGKPRRLPDEA